MTLQREMALLTKKYMACRAEPVKNVHQSLLFRSLVLLRNIKPETEEFFSPLFRRMVGAVRRPDKKGDYENGAGKHYYCAVSFTGRKINMVNGYFRSGKYSLSRNARTMMEEDHTMALTMYRAGFMESCAEHLGRAVHMLGDMCCIPHATQMTYFSPYRSLHKQYEALAAAVYPDFIPLQKTAELPDIFSDRNSFETALNTIVTETAAALKELYDDPMETAASQLRRTELLTAAYLWRFFEDTSLHEKKAHYITNSSGCRLLRDSAPLSVKITEEGIRFHGVNPSHESKVNVTDTVFFAAHRSNGLYTLSRAKDPEGLVLEVADGKFRLSKFDPVHGEQLFRF